MPLKEMQFVFLTSNPGYTVERRSCSLPRDAVKREKITAFRKLAACRCGKPRPTEMIVYRSRERQRDYAFGVKQCSGCSLVEPSCCTRRTRGRNGDWSDAINLLSVDPAQPRDVDVQLSCDVFQVISDGSSWWQLLRPLCVWHLRHHEIDLAECLGPPRKIVWKITSSDVWQ